MELEKESDSPPPVQPSPPPVPRDLMEEVEKLLQTLTPEQASLLVEGSNGRYTFTMPESRVTISANFRLPGTTPGGVGQLDDKEKTGAAPVAQKSLFSDVSLSATLSGRTKKA